jgi:hypothetical protein
MRRFVAMAGFAFVAGGCVEALSSADVASLRDAQLLDLATYRDVDSGEARANARASYCASEAVLRRNDAGPVDSGGQIACGAPK